MPSRSDRYLIGIALTVLLTAVVGLREFDSMFAKDRGLTAGPIAQLIGGEGDVRVRFNEEVRWQKGQKGQRLRVNDSIFTGPNSRADVAAGDSQLKVEANSRIVLRNENRFKSVNINYGSLSGVLAKNERWFIDTGDESKFALTAAETTTFSVVKKGGKTSVKVLDGNVQMVKDGKIQNLSSRDAISFDEKQKTDPLSFSSPAQHIFHSPASVGDVHFAWGYASQRAVGPDDWFTLEVSPDAAFRRLTMREEVKGAGSFTATLYYPQEVFYRVRDQAGNFSETRRLQLLRPAVPAILSPKIQEIIDTEAGKTADVLIETTAVEPGSRLTLTIARDAEFGDIFAAQTLLQPEITMAIPPGRYFVRVRADYQGYTTAWSAATPILLREKIPSRPARLSSRIVIPNRLYPKGLYAADPAKIRALLKDSPPFAKYFGPLSFRGHDMMIRRGGERPAVVQGAQFPAAWIEPSTVHFTYEMRSKGVVTLPPVTQLVSIEMEPPNKLTANGRGLLAWSPVLFAKGYEVELGHAKAEAIVLTSREPRYRVKTGAGIHQFRVRALNERHLPISAWSDAVEFKIGSGF